MEDPLAFANFRLAYGKYREARDIVDTALRDAPEDVA